MFWLAAHSFSSIFSSIVDILARGLSGSDAMHLAKRPDYCVKQPWLLQGRYLSGGNQVSLQYQHFQGLNSDFSK